MKDPGFAIDFIVSFRGKNGILVPILVVFTVLHSAVGCMPRPLSLAIVDSGRDRLYPSEILLPGYALVSKNRRYHAAVLDDGSFLITENGGSSAILHKADTGSRRSRLIFQDDGNVVIYSTSNVPKWSTDFYKKRMCATDRCVLIMQDDGNLVAYRGDISPENAFWSSWHSNKEVFDRVASKELSPTCPITGNPKSISSNTLSTKPFFSDPPLISISHDELFKRRRKRQTNNNNSNNNNVGRASIFDLHTSLHPEAVEDHTDMMLATDDASVLQHVTPYNQRIYYQRRHVGGFLGIGGRFVAQYVATTVRPYHLNTGQDTNDAARRYTNDLAVESGVDARSNRDMYQSLDAGHVLMRLMGGPIENWNLFPQYGRMNRVNWNALERQIAERIRNENVFVVAEYYLQYGTTYEAIPEYVHYSYRFFDTDTNRYVSSIRGVYENIVPNGQRVTYRSIYDNDDTPVAIVRDENDGRTNEELLEERNRQFANHMACLTNPFRKWSGTG